MTIYQTNYWTYLVVTGHIFPVLETQTGQAYINIVLDIKIEGIPAFTITRTRYLNLICKNDT